MTVPRDVLIAALDDLTSAEVPDDLRVPAFERVFDLHAGGTPADPAGAALVGVQSTPHEVTGGTPSGPGGDPLDGIAVRTGVDRATVAEVYDVRDGAVQLIIPTGKLSSRVASAAKEIALLLAGGRQAGGTEDWTSMDVIRDACTEFKKLDSGNFAKTIRSMEDTFNFRKESERKTSVKLSRPGWEEFTTLVRRFGGES